MYLDEIYDLSKMSYQLIASELLDEIHSEYKIIIKEKNIYHQFICEITSEGNILGVIDPAYRHGKPLKFMMDSRHMILAMCDQELLSNISHKRFPVIHDLKNYLYKASYQFKVEKVELIPLATTQRPEVHFTFRPFIEFNRVDTYGPLQRFQNPMMMYEARQQAAFYDQEVPVFNAPRTNVALDAQNLHHPDPFCLSNLLMNLVEK